MPEKQKILIVDDRRENLVALRQVLSGIDVELIEATDGNQALAATIDHDFALAILDVMMPVMDGFELAVCLRGDEKTREIPIIFLTAAQTDELQVFRGYETGAVDYIVKPYSAEILQGKVKVFLELDRTRRELQQHRDQLNGLVAERTKEIQCLQAITTLVAEPCESLEETLKTAVNLIPAGWQYPEAVCARIVTQGLTYDTANFRETPWRLSSPLYSPESAQGSTDLSVQVCYLEEKPARDEGPFLKEERHLLDNIVEQLGVLIERKRMVDALRQSEELNRRTFEQAAVGMAHVGLDGRWLSVNEKLCKILGYSRDELMQLTFQDITHPDDLEADLAYVRQVLDGEIKTYSMEKRYFRKDESIVWINLTVSLMRTPGGEPLHFIAVIEGISERKRAEQALHGAIADLERSNKELEQFAYVASHDLKEPLRMVASYTQLLARRYSEKLDQDARAYIGFAVEGATRMHYLINDLLAYSRVSVPGERMKPASSRAALDHALANLDTAIRESGAVVSADKLPTVNADHAQLAHVFQNLLANALKFRRNGKPPRIRVSAARQDGAWRFSVNDNGIGIDPQYFDRIFTIFQRLHGRDEYEGTGIGLAVCKRIVEQHGGQIWVESEPGKGSTFFFTLKGRT